MIRYLIWAAFTFFLIIPFAYGQEIRPNPALQQWIHDNHYNCCPHNNCRPVSATWTSYGWIINGNPKPFPLSQTQHWPFPYTYACKYDWNFDKQYYCLFVNSGN